jgi:hypothetical protein
MRPPRPMVLLVCLLAALLAACDADDDRSATGVDDAVSSLEGAGAAAAGDDPLDEPADGEVGEPRPLASDPPELVAFERDVVALPAGFDGSVFTPPTDGAVTVVNRSTDRLSHDDAVAFMHEALASAGWQVTQEQDAVVGLVTLEARRGTETVTVLVHLAASRTGERDVIGITVEHAS